MKNYIIIKTIRINSHSNMVNHKAQFSSNQSETRGNTFATYKYGFKRLVYETNDFDIW